MSTPRPSHTSSSTRDFMILFSPKRPWFLGLQVSPESICGLRVFASLPTSFPSLNKAATAQS